MQIQLPYGKGTLPFNVPDEHLVDIVLPREIVQPDRPELMIREALYNPFGTDRLCEIANSGDRVAVVVDDHTRPCPTQKLLPPVLEELKKAEVYDSDVLIIVASGTHDPPSFEDIKEIVGDKVVRNYCVISNDVVNGEYLSVGRSKRGNEIEILKEYVEADVKVIIGDIEFHYFAGYGGTRKSILPGISSKNTIQNNHKLMFEEDIDATVLHLNPIHQEMNEAMHLAGCDFALNVVLNSYRRIVGVWAGRPESVLDAGVKLVNNMYRVEIKEKQDIVVVASNGYPYDSDLFHSIKALHTASQVVKEKGVIILVSRCEKGHGSELYIDWLTRYKTSEEIQAALIEDFVIGAHKAYYHLKAVENSDVIFISSLDKSDVEGLFRFQHATDPDEALKKAFDIVGKDSNILVVPQGVTTFFTHTHDSSTLHR
jgi:nickel-dependent lactate racemase